MNIETMTPEFEDFLQTTHAENYAGTDDDMPKAFESWLERLTPEAWTELTEQFKTHYETLS